LSEEEGEREGVKGVRERERERERAREKERCLPSPDFMKLQHNERN